MAGGAMNYGADDAGGGTICDINVTPLVDVTLVLLIIFMVTAKLIVARGISVDTPKTVSGGEVAAAVEVAILADGSLHLNGEPAADLAVVSQFIRAKVAEEPDLRPIIAADSQVPHGEVMAVVDAVKLAGATRFAVATESAAARPAARDKVAAATARGAP